MSRLAPDQTERQSDTLIRVRGAVTQVLNGSRLRVALPNGSEVLAHISGHIRKGFIRINEGDIVGLEMSPYDLGKARITLAPQNLTTPKASGAKELYRKQARNVPGFFAVAESS